MYKNLNAEMTRAELSNTDIAKLIGISRQTVVNKKKDKSKWKLNEMIQIQNCINSKLNKNYELDYLFERSIRG